jgi:hypothetical protein
MGFIKRWSVEDIARQINSATLECTSPYHDGFTAWGVKQDLYQLKILLDDAISRCPNFGDTESEWLREQEKKKVVRILKNDI